MKDQIEKLALLEVRVDDLGDKQVALSKQLNKFRDILGTLCGSVDNLKSGLTHATDKTMALSEKYQEAQKEIQDLNKRLTVTAVIALGLIYVCVLGTVIFIRYKGG